MSLECGFEFRTFMKVTNGIIISLTREDDYPVLDEYAARWARYVHFIRVLQRHVLDLILNPAFEEYPSSRILAFAMGSNERLGGAVVERDFWSYQELVRMVSEFM